MKKLKCTFSLSGEHFTKGCFYFADDDLQEVVGNDEDNRNPWMLEDLEVRTGLGVLGRFEEVA